MELKNQPNSRVSILFIGNIEKPNEEKTFIKREVAFSIEEEVNGTVYNRIACMQTVGQTDKPQYDKTKILDEFKRGDIVDVVFGISGSTKKNEKLSPTENNPDCLNGFSNLTVTKITKVGQTQESGYQPQPNYAANTTATTSSTAVKKIPQPAGPIPKDANNQDMTWNENTGAWEALPF